jgi:hypothetical protein
MDVHLEIDSFLEIRCMIFLVVARMAVVQNAAVFAELVVDF